MATNAALTIVDAFAVVINSMTREVNGKPGVIAFPSGIVIVPESHLDSWAKALDGTEGVWGCLVVGSVEIVDDENDAPIGRAEVEKIGYAWCVATAGKVDRTFNYRDALNDIFDIHNGGLNEIKAESLVLETAGTISDTPDGSYLQFEDDVDRPDDLNDEFLFIGRRFTIGIQYGTGRVR
jgi:hypothetical protein